MKKSFVLSLTAAVALTFVACNDNDSTEAKELSVSFAEIPTPIGDAQKSLQVSNEATVNGETQSIGFTKLMATGDTDNSETYGQSKDMNDNLLTLEDGSPYLCNGTTNPKYSGSGLDFVSILQKNNKLYMVSQFECQVGSIYVNELEQSATGELSAKAGTLEFISQKDEFGGYVHCAGQTTPWNSHLGSEEYPPNARAFETDSNATSTGDTYFETVLPYWGGDASKVNPYYYGWTPEVTIDATGKANYTKHYAMGRMSHELAYVMPDNKTVYMSDDGTNVGLFMFKADTAKDLSAGTLYAAKWTQTSATNGGAANISWIELGSANNAELRTMLDPDGDVTTNDGIKFSDIFDAVEGNENGTCPTGYTAINGSAGFECLNVKNEKAAAFLETNRYAAYKGATTEFRKEEGITYDAANKKLYVAMSALERGMEDNKKSGEPNTKYDIGGNNDIKLSESNYCGAVYELNVNDNMEATDMTAIVVGEEIEKDAEGNKCHLDKISNPDNVTFLADSNILVIGEDTSKHVNNIVWAYDVKTKELTRMLATPLGAETTSPFWYKDINGFGYMTVVTQHPDTDTVDAGQSSVGVVGTFKNLK